MRAMCAHSARTMRAKCAQSACKVRTKCAQSARKVHATCVQSARKVRTKSAQITRKVRSVCTGQVSLDRYVHTCLEIPVQWLSMLPARKPPGPRRHRGGPTASAVAAPARAPRSCEGAAPSLPPVSGPLSGVLSLPTIVGSAACYSRQTQTLVSKFRYSSSAYALLE